MACRIALFAVISLFFPVELSAQWYVSSVEDSVAGGTICIAQIDGIGVRGQGRKVKTKMSLVLACKAQWPEAYLTMFFDTAPVFKVADDTVLPMKSIPMYATFDRFGSNKNKVVVAQANQWKKTPKELMFKPAFSRTILQGNLLSSYDLLSFMFIPRWDGEIVTARVPLKGAAIAIKRAITFCNSTLPKSQLQELERINRQSEEIQKGMEEMIEKLKKMAE